MIYYNNITIHVNIMFSTLSFFNGCETIISLLPLSLFQGYLVVWRYLSRRPSFRNFVAAKSLAFSLIQHNNIYGYYYLYTFYLFTNFKSRIAVPLFWSKFIICINCLYCFILLYLNIYFPMWQSKA